MVTNDKRCINPSDYQLGYCSEAINLGTEAEPKYSCTKCQSDIYVVITKSDTQQKSCHEREGDLSYCVEGTMEQNGNIKCTSCVSNSQLKDNICECNKDSFGKESKWCYKCDDDRNFGNQGCDAEKGCGYFHSNDRLDCVKCKDGYFNYTEGQCFSCSQEIKDCQKCHYDLVNEKLICDECPGNYMLNSQEKKCELINCEEYPEISEGCMICEKNRKEYIANKKCHKCKVGFFKTKDEKCIHCRDEQYGGDGCFKCRYGLDENNKETDKIICDVCPVDISYDNKNFNTSEGKCYNCNNKIKNCELCESKKSNDNNEEIVCKICKPGYYINSEGKCIYYLNYLKFKDLCSRYFFTINDISFCAYVDYQKDDSDNILFNTDDIYAQYCKYQTSKYYDDYSGNNYHEYYSYYEYKKNNNGVDIDINIPIINSSIESKCIGCISGYYLNSEGKCQEIKKEDCSLISIAKNFPQQYVICRDYCYYYDYKFIEIPYLNVNNSIKEIFYPYHFFEKFTNFISYNSSSSNNDYTSEIFDLLDDEIKPLFSESMLCAKMDEYQNFYNCERVQYDENTKSYKCSRCYNSDSLILDPITGICIYKEEKLDDDDYNCIFGNNGTEKSCTQCYNQNYLLVTDKNNLKYCQYKDNEIENCTEAIADTSYINTVYNCTECSMNYLPYYSKYFGRKICQNIYSQITREKEITLEPYEDVESVNVTDDGICEKKNFFTPGNKKCYKCNNKNVGMPGCKGNCNFSSRRNDIIKCEDGCETGYIEVKEGVCESCENINSGCYECHYEDKYPDNYLKIKRERRFVCDYCQDGFIKLDGKCLTCEDIGLDECEECDIDPNNNNKYICTKCNKFNILENGKCEDCDDGDEFIINNKCVDCNNVQNGGIKGCNYCERNDENKLICQICDDNYILLTNNNTCLNILKNKELEKFEDFCEHLTLDNNNQLYCSKCKQKFTLLKNNDNDKGVCIQIPGLYDYDIYENMYNVYNFFYHSYYSIEENRYVYYYDDEYYEYQNYRNYPCQEAINIGTKENPIYSCTKCYGRFEYEKIYRDEDEYTRLINPRNNISFCTNQNEDLFENCSVAINKTENGIQKYDCVQCITNNHLIYDYDSDIHYCKYANNEKCMIKYCKTCRKGNSYFCEECLLSNYEVNSISGQCVEKSEVVPAITWKDIFRLEMNGENEVNGETVKGPSLMLRGITDSQINSRHAFLIYMTFKLRSSLRNLELKETVSIPAICEVQDGVEGTSDDVNIVDYKCVANNSENVDLTKYDFEEIKEAEKGENEGLLKNSNLNQLSQEKKNTDLTKSEPSFTFEDLMKYATFEMNNIQNQTAKDNIFDFKLEGKLNKEIEKGTFNKELDLNEIEDKINCSFVVEDNKNASLNCKIDINNHKDKSIFSFKTSEIETDKNNIYLAKLNEVYLLNINEQEKKEDKTNIGLIVGCTIAGVVLVGGGIALVVFLLKRKNNSIPDTANNNPRMKAMVGNNINNGNKIIPMEMGPESKDPMS